MSDVAVRVTERRLGTLPWLVVRGPATEAFTYLGMHLRTEIGEIVDGLPVLAALRAEPSDAVRATTLCTFVADLTGDEATIVCRDAEPVTVPLSSLPNG
jgi:hypothetical protein